MGNVWKFLLLAVGCIIVVALITLSLRISKKGETDTADNLELYHRVAGEAVNMDIKMYEGTEVLGSEIKQLIRKYYEDDYLSIKVTNGKNDTEDYIHGSTITNGVAAIGTALTTGISVDPQDDNYINDSGIFKAEVLYDQNDIVACIRFRQQ